MENSDLKISHTWSFGEDEALADKLRQLVISGKKRASTGMYREGGEIPKVGEYESIAGSDQKPFCIVQCTNVEIKPFLEVDYEFIQKEGEGDRNIEEWREKHREFFGLKDDNVKVVCEEFKVVSVM